MPGPLDLFLPLVVGAVLLALAYAPWFRREGSWAIAPVIAIAFAVAYRIIVGSFPSIPATNATGWILYAAVASAVVGVAVHLWRSADWVVSILGGVLGAAAGAAVLRALLLREETRGAAVIWIAGAAVLGIAWTIAFATGSTRQRPRSTLTAMAIFSVLCGALMGMSHSFTYGRLGAALGGAVAAVAGAAVLARRLDPVPAAIVACTTLVALCLAASRFAELTHVSASSIAIAPVAFRIAAGRLLVRKPAVNTLLSIACMCLPLAAAIALAMPGFLKTISDPTDPYAP